MRAIRDAALVLFLLTACGGKGGGGGGSAPAPHPETPTPPPPTGALLTSVGLDAMGYRLPATASCLVRADEGAVPTFPGGTFQVDGDISEWASIPSRLSDNLADGPAGADLAVASVAVSGDDLALMFLASPSPGVSLGIEIGSGYLRHGALGGDIIVRLRVRDGVLERMAAGSWQAVTADLGQLASAGPNHEIRLGRSLIGEALTYPAWSVRLFTLDEATGVTLDTTHTGYFSSWLQADKPQFTFSTCKEWYTQLAAIELVEVREAQPAANWKGDEKTLAAAFDRVSALSRLAVDMSNQIFHGENPPVMSLPVFETYGPADGNAFSSSYAAATVEIGPFDADGINAFPEGPVFRAISERTIEAYLLSLFPAADLGLRVALRQALVDHLVRSAFGSSYFFDTYRATLASGSQDVAYGHVLAGVMSSDQLVGGWKRLAAGAAASDVFGPYTSVTRDQALAAVGDTDFDGLPDNYEAVFGTDPKLQDSDGDAWSDLAEVVSSEDPLAQTRQPNRIMPDGNFDDWLTLFPQKVHLDEGHSTVCPVAADINFYAALATRDELMIGAVAKEFWEGDPHASWEAVIDLPNAKRQFLVSVPSDSYATTVKDPDTGKVLLTIERAFPQGRKTVEWVIRRQDLKLDAFFDEPDSVRVRIRTLFHDADGKDNYCDETAWFAPYVTQ